MEQTEPGTAPESALESARRLFFEGLAALQAGRLEDAERAFLASLEAVPGRPSTLLNLATTRLRMHRPVEAIAAVDAVLAAQPGDVDALAVRAMSLARLGLQEQALAAYDRVLEADPHLAEMWSQRGSLLREMGRLDEAAQAYEQARARGDDNALTGYFLAAVARGETPLAAPPRYIESLFDDYAIEFDQHLVGVLGYRAHATLVENMPERATRRFASALDLGCGTGLCGPLVKPHATRLVGVDLASRMLEQARALGVYDELVHAELIAWLAANRERFDLIVSADVLIYIGDLEPLFAGARRALAPGGMFCFSIELGAGSDDGASFTLQPSLRYTHAERYIAELATRHGFATLRALRAPIREDQKQSVAGAYFYLSVGEAAGEAAPPVGRM
ncbi:MAG: methyltransferase domain-containing protein [Burkholderiales bacterium]|nr:methyltransferase domain-containing protein [Burkholderiales bacterium]